MVLLPHDGTDTKPFGWKLSWQLQVIHRWHLQVIHRCPGRHILRLLLPGLVQLPHRLRVHLMQGHQVQFVRHQPDRLRLLHLALGAF